MSTISGKHVIIAIVALALLAAAASWWVRYEATHRAAEFWGPTAARRIRDAPFVELYYINDDPNVLATIREISKAPGLTHLRHALLEDRSYVWPAQPAAGQPRWRWAIGFKEADGKSMTLVAFTSDWKRLTNLRSGNNQFVSSAPIAESMATMFPDLMPQKSEPR
jgi:hypothetical protein